MNRESRFDGSDELIIIDRSGRRRTLLIVAALVGALVILLGAWAMMRSTGPAAPPAGAAGGGRGQVPTISVVVPGRADVARVVTASGALAARRDQPVGISGQGGRVTRVLVDAGAYVRAGQTLATVERSVQSQLAAQQAAQIAAARANAALAQNNFERAQSLVSRGFVSKADLDAKRAARDSANAQIRVAEAQLGQTRAQIGQLDIRAPSAGLVLARNVEVGQIVSAGSGGLFRIAAGGEMELRAEMSQQDLSLVRAGMPATVTPVGSTRSVSGTVWQVSPIIDPQSRQGEVRISIPYTADIRPGGFAEVRIASGSASAPVLPQSAVLSDSKGNYVYIVNAKNEIERRAVTVGSVGAGGISIAAGLTGQEAVVESAGPFVNPGQKVAPRRVASGAR